MRLGERRYNSYSFTTSALDGGEWSASRPGRALSPGKEPPVPIVQEAGWAPEPQRVKQRTKKYKEIKELLTDVMACMSVLICFVFVLKRLALGKPIIK
jgi:hypothetical protein